MSTELERILYTAAQAVIGAVLATESTDDITLRTLAFAVITSLLGYLSSVIRRRQARITDDTDEA